MSYQVSSLKPEKITFTVIISILLFSLIYISSSTFLLRNENLKFKNHVESAKKEINLLLRVDIPTKDSVIEEQKHEILIQATRIEEELSRNRMSAEERKILRQKLESLRRQAGKLREKITQTEQEQIEEARRIISMSNNKKDSLLGAYKNQVAMLQRKVKTLEDERKERPRPVVTTRTVVVKEKLNTFYFSARPSDRRNRASRTDFIILQLQLKGDVSTLKCHWLQIEIRDPDNNIITDQRDKIEAASDHRTEYMFMPTLPRKVFTKGKYSIKIFCPDSDYEHIEFFSLV